MGTNASVLLVNKRSGLTSFSALGKIKRTIDKKVGHAGTLDKFAQGLLVVLTGSMTRLNVLFSQMDKQYRATILFGEETDTLDPEGKVVASAPCPDFETIQKAIKEHFLGTIKQQPPQYSALHVEGKRASSLARSGKTVEMASRLVTVYSFDVVSYENNRLICDIHVSKGTYIRSIARDLALACNSRGHLVELTRTAIGPYRLDEAFDFDDTGNLIRSMENTEQLLHRLPSLSWYAVPKEDEFMMVNGTCSPNLACEVEKGSALYGAVHDTMGDLRWIVDMKTKRIISQIPQKAGELATI